MSTSRVLLMAAFLLLLLATGVLAQGVLRKSRLDSSGQEFAVTVTRRALTGESDFLLAHAHSSWVQEQSAETLSRYLAHVTQTLGPLQALQRISGNTEVPLWILSAELPTAHYSLDLEFTDATASVNLNLLYQDEHWQVTEFVVLSPALLE